MSEIAGQTGIRGAADAVVNESYSFACMRCGHGWEQSYEIEHHTDAGGDQFVVYVADGRVVPSPLSRPACQNCDGHVVRIMRAGQVSSVQHHLHRQQTRSVPDAPAAEDAPADGGATTTVLADVRRERQPWHLSDLLHPFQRRAS
ncbi:hypothetical protein ACIQU5_10960 [Streptomyces sp. NPDC090306]|uniref:hypothetical protein n=1 Tax=unclassified Streptomyces TaxID=2593676 RepID=UPI0036E0568C